MPSDNLSILSLADDSAAVARAMGACFREYGFALVTDHDLDAELIERAWRLTREFFALPEAEKRSYALPGLAGARGYTPFGVEIAKGALHRDLKEFWHVGREPPGTGMPDNLWPDRPAGFRETFVHLFAEFDRIGGILLSRLALDLGLAPDWFNDVAEGGNSVLRLLHYPPVTSEPGGAVRAEAHEDINLVTLLLGAEEAGLELLTRDGHWLAVEPPDGALVVNIGDMLQRLTNHVLPSTTHRVRNPTGAQAEHSRYAMPFFLHPRSDFLIRTLPVCVSAKNPDRYPEPITADDYLQERLQEIGLK
jgi:isopenicillin N synthase-like dioxygenase